MEFTILVCKWCPESSFYTLNDLLEHGFRMHELPPLTEVKTNEGEIGYINTKNWENVLGDCFLKFD